MIRTFWIFLIVVGAAAPALAQQGYVLVGSSDLPNPFLFMAPPSAVTVSPGREDVRSLGRGLASTGYAGSFSPLQANPALLREGTNSVEVLGLSAGLPPRTFDAVSFISDHMKDFETGEFIRLLWDGYEEFRTATTTQGKLAGMEKMNRGLSFPKQAIREVTGPTGALHTHGLGVVPFVSVQRGVWGFSVHNSLQLGFQVSPGSTIESLAGIELPESPSLVGASLLLQLLRTLNDAIDLAGNVRTEALPRAFAVSTNDIVATAGRSFDVGEHLNVGASVKLVNRRFSSKIIDPENMSSVLSEVRSEFTASRTGVTGDLGIVYRAPFGTTFGLTAQNVIPLTEIASTAQLTYRGTQTFYINGSGQPTTDANAALVGHYNRSTDTFTPDPNGDTLIYALGYTIDARLPFELKAPMIASVGAAHAINESWDIMADWYDLAGKDSRLESGIGPRLRIGTEWRFWTGLLAIRAGLQQEHVTAGIGLDLGPVGIDGASAFDPFTGVRAWFAQVRVGW